MDSKSRLSSSRNKVTIFERLREKGVSLKDLEKTAMQLCPKCGINPAQNCGYGEVVYPHYDEDPEFECFAPDAEELECGGCKYLMCGGCKDEEGLQGKSGDS